ncbi:MAG: pilus assembly protein [Lachnospiraceae bacterium]|nr:pilus assembly protein [Lachnospiraceae bacterium]
MKKKGSFTVEAAVLVPLALITVFVLIWLVLFVYDHMVMKHAAGELAVHILEKRMSGDDADHDAAETGEVLEKKFMVSGNVAIDSEVSSRAAGLQEECTVRITADIKSPLNIFSALFGRSHSVTARATAADIKRYRFLKENGKELTGAAPGQDTK